MPCRRLLRVWYRRSVEANDPALPGGGHADATDQNIDYQFDGVQ